MGGADLALTHTPAALDINPAGLDGVTGQAFEATVGLAFATDISHRDQLGNDVSISNSPVGLADGGYAHRFGQFTFGVGVFAQGGVGNVYKNVITPAGNRDELSGVFGVLRATAGVAWRAKPGLSVGLAVDMNAARAKQKIFPNTSTPTFAGLELSDARAVAPGWSIGIQGQISPKLEVAAQYSSKTALNLSHGKLVADYSALGLGKVTYANAELNGLALPQRVGIGVAVQPAAHWTLAFDVDWINWANALRTSTLRATAPDSAAAPPQIELTSPLEWKNQFVFALGAAWELDEQTTLRVGYNYGKNPIPPQNLTPLLNAIAERDLTVGLGYRLSRSWRIDGALEWAMTNRVHYTNPSSPLGPDNTESLGYVAFLVTLGRQW